MAIFEFFLLSFWLLDSPVRSLNWIEKNNLVVQNY